VAPGHFVCHEGDPPGSAYVICSGRVRVFRRDLTNIGESVELAQLGTGAVTGELAPLLDQPRNASVQAIEPTQILEITPSQLSVVLRTQIGLQRVIAHALTERSGLTAGAIREPAAKLGVELSKDVLPDEDPDSSHGIACACSEASAALCEEHGLSGVPHRVLDLGRTTAAGTTRGA
jgi:hypothetical protein